MQSVLTQPFVCFLAAQWCKLCWAVAVDVLLCCRVQKHANYRCCQRFLGPANLSLTVYHGSVREWAGCPMVSTTSDGWSGCCTTLFDAKTRGIALLTRSSTACKPVFCASQTFAACLCDPVLRCSGVPRFPLHPDVGLDVVEGPPSQKQCVHYF